MASALVQKRPKVEASELVGDREARIAARKKGRNAGGIKTVVVDTGDQDDDGWGDGGVPVSRSIDAATAERLARRVVKIKWADEHRGRAELVLQEDQRCKNRRRP